MDEEELMTLLLEAEGVAIGGERYECECLWCLTLRYSRFFCAAFGWSWKPRQTVLLVILHILNFIYLSIGSIIVSQTSQSLYGRYIFVLKLTDHDAEVNKWFYATNDLLGCLKFHLLQSNTFLKKCPGWLLIDLTIKAKLQTSWPYGDSQKY